MTRFGCVYYFATGHMATTDIKLNNEVIEAECVVFQINCSDLRIDPAARRGNAGSASRRAIVHGKGDVLITNSNNDYTGVKAIAETP